MVNSVFYNIDESLMFVFYKDSALEVYNTADMSLQNRIEGISSVSLNTFLGRTRMAIYLSAEAAATAIC